MTSYGAPNRHVNYLRENTNLFVDLLILKYFYSLFWTYNKFLYIYIYIYI